MSEAKKKAKFRFKCTSCGACCHDREPVPVTIDDLDRWATNKVIDRMFQYLRIVQQPTGITQLVIDVDSKEKGTGDEEEKQAGTRKGKCPMYNPDTKKCMIWSERPLYCRSFPLGYDGQVAYIKMDDCPGLDSVEEMDKELLKQMRDDARREFESARLLGITLPIMQALVMKDLQEQQLRLLSKLSPEQLEKLQKLQDVFSEVEPGEK